MIGCIRRGALLAVLASAGMAWGQTAAPGRGAAPPAGRTVTVQEKDGLPEQCRLLQSWTTGDGRKACLVEVLDSGERLTVVQKGAPAGGTRQVGAVIWRWSNSGAPPVGSPVPPPDRVPAGVVRQVAHAAEAPELPPPTAVPHLAPVPAPPGADCAPPPRAAGTGGLLGSDKGHSTYVHHYEPPPHLEFRAGECLPVCTPDHAPAYGYYPTQWRPWPGNVAAPVPAPGQTQ